ncbi:hypothetical protein E2320_005665 [Naja naja]|nr:hypothetical protein E2320_005665 [Naja naja]
MTHGHHEGCLPKDFFQAARVGRKIWSEKHRGHVTWRRRPLQVKSSLRRRRLRAHGASDQDDGSGGSLVGEKAFKNLGWSLGGWVDLRGPGP